MLERSTRNSRVPEVHPLFARPFRRHTCVMTGGLDQRKAELRARVRRTLRSMDLADRAQEAAEIRRCLRAWPAWAGARTVLGYMPLASEVDLRPLLAEAIARGVTVAVPVSDPDGSMRPCRLASLEPAHLETDGMGIAVPKRREPVAVDAIEITVLDEADHMADLGFLPVVTRILHATPENGQRMLFSATLDNGVDKLVNRYLHNEILHSVDEANSPVAAMTHHVFETMSVESKKQLVEALASGTGRRILFMRTKHHAKKLAQALTAAGIPAVDLHGNLSQPARDRNLAAFSSGDVKVLVATDVAARGVHVDDIELVIHVDPPMEHKAYLHRSGRTARAGSEGDVVTICLPTQKKDLAALLKKADITVTPVQVTASSPEVVALIGEVAAFVKPAPKTAQPQRQGTSTGANAQRKRANRDQRDRSGRPGNSGSSARPAGEASRRGQRSTGSPAVSQRRRSSSPTSR
ncbi:MAG: DEAD/DEAH box helicase [Microbacteriaceae bacterium]|nr:DEAD/DEAH box helicase [Microbacteriaceae bacterium]